MCGTTKFEVQSFKQQKEVFSASPVLKYFDCKANTELQCESSDKGLNACLMQGGLPVAYGSRAMTPAEVSYAQIEKELLAIVFGVKRSTRSLQGLLVKLETDQAFGVNLQEKSD